MKFCRTRDPEATRAALLDAAEEVFLEKGIGNASMSEIAKRAGITKSLIHHYFGSKEGLWEEVKMRRFVQYADTQKAMLQEAEPSIDLLRESLKYYFQFLKDNPQLVRILAWMFLERDIACIEKDRELINIGLEKIQAGQQRGEIRDDIDAKYILFTFLGLCQHWFQDKEHFINDFCAGEATENLDQEYLDAIIKIFFNGVLAR